MTRNWTTTVYVDTSSTGDWKSWKVIISLRIETFISALSCGRVAVGNMSDQLILSYWMTRRRKIQLVDLWRSCKIPFRIINLCFIGLDCIISVLVRREYETFLLRLTLLYSSGKRENGEARNCHRNDKNVLFIVALWQLRVTIARRSRSECVDEKLKWHRALGTKSIRLWINKFTFKINCS